MCPTKILYVGDGPLVLGATRDLLEFEGRNIQACWDRVNVRLQALHMAAMGFTAG